MSKTKREKSQDYGCNFEWGGTGKDSAGVDYRCPHICKIDWKHDGYHYCCEARDGIYDQEETK